MSWDVPWILMLLLAVGQGFTILTLGIVLWRRRVQGAQNRGESSFIERRGHLSDLPSHLFFMGGVERNIALSYLVTSLYLWLLLPRGFNFSLQT
jgi:hypothetical protein